MKKIVFALLAGALLGAVGSRFALKHPEHEPGEKKSAESESSSIGLHLTKEQQANAGITLVKPEPMKLKSGVKAFGRVLDPAPLAALLAEREAAQATAVASTKEFERLKTLGDNAAVRALESAEAAKKRDQVALDLAQARLLTTWGKNLSERADLAALANALVMQTAALVRVDLAAGDSLVAEPAGIQIAPLAGKADFQDAELIGSGPTADLQTQGRGFLALARASSLPPGTALAARIVLPGLPQEGFRIPGEALVQHENGIFVYIQTGDDSFLRKRVEPGPPQRAGAFVSSGLSPEDRVVARGAQQLLSEELKRVSSGE